MRNNIHVIASLVALFLLLFTAGWFVHTGMHEGTLLGVLITGAVAVAQAVAGIKSTPPAPPSIVNTNTQAPPATQPNEVTQ